MNRRLRYFLLILIFLFSIQIQVSADKKGFPTIYSDQSLVGNGTTVKRYGLLNEDGIRLTEPIFDKISQFSSNGLALIRQNGNYGFINTKGESFLLSGVYEARSFDEYGLAAIKQNSKWGLIDSEMKYVLKNIFDKIEKFQANGLAIVKYDNKFGLIDTLGNVVLPVIYDKIENFDKSGYAILKSGNKIGIVNKRGRAVVPPEYKDKKSALAALSNEKPKFGNSTVSMTVNQSHGNKTYLDNSNIDNPRQEEEQRLLAEKARQEEEQRLIAEKARQEEEQRLIAEKARQEEEQRLIAEKARQEEEQRLIAEKARQEEEQRLLAEKARQEEEQRLSEVRKKFEETPTLNNYIYAHLGEWSDYLVSKKIDIPSEEEIRSIIDAEIAKWQVKGEFEPTAKWKERVNETTRTAKINFMADSILSIASHKIDEVRAEYKREYEALADKYCAGIADQFASQSLELKPYDADNETFLISTTDFGDFLLPVPLAEAPDFKKEWDKWKDTASATFIPNGDDVALKSVRISKYSYDSDMNAKYARVDVEYNFKPVDLNLLNNQLDMGDELALNSTDNERQKKSKSFQTETIKISASDIADTDFDIPVVPTNNNTTFAVIIANGDYNHASKVSHAKNDGLIMSQYLTRTMGIPETNVATFINATYGQMASAISMLQDIGDAYKGSDFNIIFYYVGHGLPDDDAKKTYILPVDIDPRHVSICMPLEKIFADLGNVGAKNVTVMVDACFSGTNHGEGMLIPQSMGVALKPKKAAPVGNMVVLTAADGNETAFPYEEKKHGLFTYWLLKKLKETKGKVSMGELSDFIIDNVKKTSVIINKKPQTPTVAISPQLSQTWREIRFGQ